MAASPRPNAVIFDFGGVLVDWDPRYLYRTLFAGDESAMEQFLADVVTPAWNLEQDRGRSFDEAIEVLVAEHPQHEPMIRAFRDRWIETIGGAHEDTVAILAELRAAGVRLFGLTNWSAETFPHALERFPFFAWFEDIVVSGQVRLVKPDPAIFRILLDRHNLEPRRTVFVDDSKANADAAAALGLHGIHFQGAGDFRRRLVELGLLRAEAPGTSA
jgi:2-haloacid dehalogenase